MKKNIKNKEYKIQEAVAYYILGYERYKKENNDNDFLEILKKILEIANENIDTIEIKGVNQEYIHTTQEER